MGPVRILVAHHDAHINQKIPIKRLPDIVLDDTAKACLAKNGLDFESVPTLNQKDDLRPAQSTFWGADPEFVTHMLHPANAEIDLRAVKLFSLSCARVDFISTNISIPWFENGAVINEVNYAPVIGRTHEYQNWVQENIWKHFSLTREEFLSKYTLANRAVNLPCKDTRN